MFGNVYRDRRVLITGHTGFKGSWLSFWLHQLGAELAGFSNEIPTKPSLFEVLGLQSRLRHYVGTVLDPEALERCIDDFRPDVIFHLAAQPIVRRSYSEPVLTIRTNSIGTLNVLEAIRTRSHISVGVFITTDKCYRNVEWTWGYRECDQLGGDDPYSASKSCAENICYAYTRSFFAKNDTAAIASARAGNVIGGGDWAADRIVPDCMRAWSENRAVNVRHPNATRPWQHVLEPLSGYLWLGAKLLLNDPAARGQSYNFGPQADVYQTVEQVMLKLAESWPGAQWSPDPEGLKEKPEATFLKLCCDKALHELGWHAVLSFRRTAEFTGSWYRTYYDKGPDPMRDVTAKQIYDYTDIARQAGLPWAAA